MDPSRETDDAPHSLVRAFGGAPGLEGNCNVLLVEFDGSIPVNNITPYSVCGILCTVCSPRIESANLTLTEYVLCTEYGSKSG